MSGEEAAGRLPIIDAHVHVGLLGDEFPDRGHMSDWYRRQVTYRVFLLYGGLDADRVCDRTLRETTELVIRRSGLDAVVCLALDPVYAPDGTRQEHRSHVWIDNAYVLDLRNTCGDKVLFGASVHPFDPAFESRVKQCVDEGAVLLKWLPSAQQIDPADERVASALEFLATAGPGGKPLPLLLHVGPEYAIPSTDPRTQSYDFLSWTHRDRFWNWWRGGKRWHTPRLERVHGNLRRGLNAGATVILAHCGLPYFAGGILRGWLEHSDFEAVKSYLDGNAARATGRCYADVSACCTPFRRTCFRKIRSLPAEYLLFGSDFPTPVFELSGGIPEAIRDLKAVLKGRFERIIVPQDNLLDVNLRELSLAFPGHPMFTNAARLFEVRRADPASADENAPNE